MGDETLIFRSGVWFPKYDEANADRLAAYIRRNLTDITLSVAQCQQQKLCVQAGGHVGLWPRYLADYFKTVMTFEPQPLAFAAMLENLRSHPRIVADPRGLWRETGPLWIAAGADSGTWRTNDTGAPGFAEKPAESINVVAIDDLKLEQCDAIYLDVEGSEAEVLKGAYQTIDKFRPVLHLEILPRSRAAIEKEIAFLRYKFVVSVHKDSIFVPAKG